jgi:hypothetical protein
MFPPKSSLPCGLLMVHILDLSGSRCGYEVYLTRSEMNDQYFRTATLNVPFGSLSQNPKRNIELPQPGNYNQMQRAGSWVRLKDRGLCVNCGNLNKCRLPDKDHEVVHCEEHI